MDMELFNKLVKPGDMVSVVMEDGTRKSCRLLSPAQEVGSRALVNVEGVAYPLTLDLVTPIANGKDVGGVEAAGSTRQAPYSLHPVTGSIVDANHKAVLIPLTSAYGAADAAKLAQQVIAMLNKSEAN